MHHPAGLCDREEMDSLSIFDLLCARMSGRAEKHYRDQEPDTVGPEHEVADLLQAAASTGAAPAAAAAAAPAPTTTAGSTASAGPAAAASLANNAPAVASAPGHASVLVSKRQVCTQAQILVRDWLLDPEAIVDTTTPLPPLLLPTCAQALERLGERAVEVAAAASHSQKNESLQFIYDVLNGPPTTDGGRLAAWLAEHEPRPALAAQQGADIASMAMRAGLAPLLHTDVAVCYPGKGAPYAVNFAKLGGAHSRFERVRERAGDLTMCSRSCGT